ncbi:MAG: glycoside hydrolase family 99-like domain-containing protein [Candidatus Symbiothrix sp.]|jgi:hypothetical protein|nr:glycoside hydrolase family 99-like domain-containing protein [Candidatus Symbiothrix sp.]
MKKIFNRKTFNILSIGLLLGIAVASCEDKPEVYEFPVSEYFYEIPDVPVTEDYVIGVQYDVKRKDSANQVWWDNGKQIPQPYTGTPLLGEYDMKDDLNRMLRQQLDWGKEGGIDFFIFSIGGRGYNDTILMKWEEIWQEGDPRVVIRFDPGYRYPSATGDTLMKNKAVMDSLKFEFDSLYTNVMTKNFAYKNKNTNQPVMILCNYVDKPGHILNLQEYINLFRGKNTYPGKDRGTENDIWMIGELPSNWSSPENWGYRDETTIGRVKGDTISVFEAVTITNFEFNNYDRYLGMYSFYDYNNRYWQERLLPRGKEYIPMIFPAYDNRVREPLSTNFLIPRWKDNGTEEENGPYVVSSNYVEVVDGVSTEINTLYNLSGTKKNPYQELANVAKRNVGPSRIIILRSWNNFGEGNTLEPAVEYQKDYLRYTKQFFKK